MKTIRDYLSMLLIILFIILSTSLYFTIDSNSKKTAEIKRLQNNQEILFGKIKFIEKEKSAVVERLEMTKKEFAAYIKEKDIEIKKLNIKIGNIQTYSSTVIETKFIQNIPIHDTVIIRDTLHYFEFNKNPYIDIKGWINDKTKKVDIDFSTTDTLTTIAYRIPYKFLFIHWGTKAIMQKVTTASPYSKIVYTEYIKVINRRKED